LQIDLSNVIQSVGMNSNDMLIALEIGS